MNDIFAAMKRYSKEGAVYALFATSIFCLLYHVGAFGNAFLPVMGNLFLMLVEVALWVVLPVLLCVGKHDEAKGAFRPIFTFWILYTIIRYLEESIALGNGKGGLVISTGVFELLIACAFGVLAVFALLAITKNRQDFKKTILFVFLGCLVLCLVTFSLRIALLARGKAGWNNYFGVIYKYLTLPFAMFFLMLHFEYTFDDLKIFPETAPAITPKEEMKASVLEEAPTPAPEKNQEERVAEEKAEGGAIETETLAAKEEESPAEAPLAKAEEKSETSAPEAKEEKTLRKASGEKTAKAPRKAPAAKSAQTAKKTPSAKKPSSQKKASED